MGAWNQGIFGNDSAMDWLCELEAVNDTAALRALVRRPFDECSAFAANAVDGVVTTTFTDDELEAMVAHAISEIDDDALRTELEPEIRAAWTGPQQDFGTHAAEQAIAAAAYVLARAGGDSAKTMLRSLKGLPAAWVPDADIVRDARAAVVALAGHRERLREDRRWKQKVAGLVAGLEALG